MGYYKCQIPGLHFPLMTLIDYRGYRYEQKKKKKK